MRLAVNVRDENDTKTRQNGERGGVGSAENDVCISDCCGVFCGALAQDPVAADPGPHAGAAEAQPVRPGGR